MIQRSAGWGLLSAAGCQTVSRVHSQSGHPRPRGFHVAFAAMLSIANDNLQLRCRKHIPSEAPKIRIITSDGSCDCHRVDMVQ